MFRRPILSAIFYKCMRSICIYKNNFNELENRHLELQIWSFHFFKNKIEDAQNKFNHTESDSTKIKAHFFKKLYFLLWNLICLLKIFKGDTMSTKIFCFTLLFSFFLNAEENTFLTNNISNWVKKSGFLDFLTGPNECPLYYEHLPEMDVDELFKKAFQLRVQKKDCESARYFSEIRLQWPIYPHYQKAWVELIKSYILADDYIEAINEANLFLDQNKNIPEAEQIHLIIINAVNDKMISAGSTKSQEWTEYALGISKSQNDQNPFLKNLSFKSYLDNYPNSKNRGMIENMITVARNNHARYQLDVGHFYATRTMPGMTIPNYPAAIMRYDVVLKWGPIVTSYNEAVYSTVYIFLKMIEAIKNPDVLPDNKLKEWLHIDTNVNKSTVDREKIVTEIKMQINHIGSKLTAEKIAQDDWIQRTKVLIKSVDH